MPIPLIASAIGTLGPAVAKYFGAQAAAKNNRQDPNKIGAEFDQLQADTPQYSLDKGWNQYLNAAKQDPAADMQRQIAAEQEATNIGALKSGGAKALLGGLGASQRQSSMNRMGIEADSFERQQTAQKDYNAASQRINDANTASDRDFAKSKFGAVRDANLFNEKLDAAANQAPWDALASGLGMFGQGMLGGKTDLSTDFEGSGFENLTGRSFGSGAFGGGGGTLQNGYGGFDSGFDPSKYGLNTLKGFTGFTGKQGGMVTPGEFSHETNPIDMLKDGAKIGEMTGGEVILNPEQQEKVAKQSPIFRKLMREFAMKAKK
jgi:hypothetical protein